VGPQLLGCDDLVLDVVQRASVDVAVHAADPLVRADRPRLVVRGHLVTRLAELGRFGRAEDRTRGCRRHAGEGQHESDSDQRVRDYSGSESQDHVHLVVGGGERGPS